MQALGASQYGRQGLDGHPDDVIVRLPGGQGGASGLGMEAKHHRFRVPGLEFFFHHPGPNSPGSPELGHLLEQIVIGIEEKGEPAGELIHIQTGFHGRPYVFNAVGYGEGDLLNGV